MNLVPFMTSRTVCNPNLLLKDAFIFRSQNSDLSRGGMVGLGRGEAAVVGGGGARVGGCGCSRFPAGKQ